MRSRRRTVPEGNEPHASALRRFEKPRWKMLRRNSNSLRRVRISGLAYCSFRNPEGTQTGHSVGFQVSGPVTTKYSESLAYLAALNPKLHVSAKRGQQRGTILQDRLAS